MTFYIFSQGTLSSADEVNYNFNKTFQLQGEKAINDVSATNSGVLAGSSQVLIDKFLDANGQNNTVDTVDTDALFLTNLYECNQFLATNPIVNPSFESVGDWIYSEVDTIESYTGSYSNLWATKGTYSYKLSKSGRDPHSSDYAQILQNVDFTNIDKLYFDYNFTQSNYHSVEVYIDNSLVYNSSITGNHYNVAIDCSSITGTKSLVFRLKCTASAQVFTTANLYIDNIRSAGTVYFDSTIQSSATTIPTGMTKVFVTPLMYEALATGDNITADVSIDNGAHYTTGVPINTWSPITSANGTQLIVKANLLTGSGATTPKVLGWRVLME